MVQVPDLTGDLLAAAVTVHAAARVGMPHLATRAAYAVVELVPLVVDDLAAARAVVAVDDEQELLARIPNLAGLVRLGISPLAASGDDEEDSDDA